MYYIVYCFNYSPLPQRYGHFDTKNCKLFRDEDYRPADEDKDGTNADANVPGHNELSLLENLLESGCPRCGFVRTHNLIA